MYRYLHSASFHKGTRTLVKIVWYRQRIYGADQRNKFIHKKRDQIKFTEKALFNEASN